MSHVPAAPEPGAAAVERHAAGVTFDGVGFSWPGEAQPLLDGFGMSVPPGSICAIVGPSGCGKSTLLRLAAGLLQPAAGTVAPGRTAPGRTAFVFQHPNLLPWRTVADNVGLPLELLGVPPDQRRRRIADVLALVELADDDALLPGALSGGMQMRASLARAWVGAPSLMLMDEPFAALDALTRRRMLERFQRLWAQARPTVLLVTHDIDEAVLLADRVLVVAERPLQLRAQVPVDLPRPRPARLRHDPRVGALVEQIEALL